MSTHPPLQKHAGQNEQPEQSTCTQALSQPCSSNSCCVKSRQRSLLWCGCATNAHQLEYAHRAMFWSIAATVTADGVLAGEARHASLPLLPAGQRSEDQCMP